MDLWWIWSFKASNDLHWKWKDTAARVSGNGLATRLLRSKRTDKPLSLWTHGITKKGTYNGICLKVKKESTYNIAYFKISISNKHFLSYVVCYLIDLYTSIYRMIVAMPKLLNKFRTLKQRSKRKGGVFRQSMHRYVGSARSWSPCKNSQFKWIMPRTIHVVMQMKRAPSITTNTRLAFIPWLYITGMEREPFNTRAYLASQRRRDTQSRYSRDQDEVFPCLLHRSQRQPWHHQFVAHHPRHRPHDHSR